MSELDDTKSRLLEAAGEEFALKGFEGATIRSICDRAKVNLAGVNYHFRNKEQLYSEAVIAAHQFRGRIALELPLESLPPTEALRLYIYSFLKNVLEIQRDTKTWRSELMMREIFHPTEACDALVRQSIRPQFIRLRGILNRICPEADETRLDVMAFSIVGQCLHYKMANAICQRLMTTERYVQLDLDYLTDHITGFTLAALGLAAPLDEAGRPGGVIVEAASLEG